MGSIAQPVLIVTAARVEARPLLTGGVEAAGPRGCFRLGGIPAQVRLLVAGVGSAGDSVLRRALAELRPRSVVNLGYAGALDLNLAPGDAVIGTGWILAPDLEPDPDLPRTSGALRDWIQAALRDRGLVPRIGSLLTVEAPFHDRLERDRIHRRSGALAVEMESARWARLAAAARADFVALRVISDRADLRLPLPRHRLLRPDGTVRWARWLVALAGSGGGRHLRRELERLHRARIDWVAAGRGLQHVCEALAVALGDETPRRST